MNILKLQNNIFKVFIELFIFNKKKRSRMKANWAKIQLLSQRANRTQYFGCIGIKELKTRH